ncbi:SDR family oxidoreductase [Actinokineospora inagensis]|uniref:SDR family oxidoreductase n=1 Tax=Actinokineospora inagensis TaxID=103730 RepID=UPI00040E7B17|nr:SDR family oxidoreductase [Actinokineospora inagensis]
MTRQNILITGASAGLGAEMARQFAALGRTLVLAARRTDRLAEVRQQLLRANPGITVLVKALDVTDHDAVFRVFAEAKAELGTLDRVVVNAGLGKGQPLGTGYFHANKQTAETNFVAALAQCEAAMTAFRAQDAGHLVVVSSMSAMRGLPRTMSTYAASKAGIAALAEGVRADTLRTPIKVTTLFPGYIRSEMNARARKTPLLVDTEPGVRAMVRAMEREVATACVPAWPWTVVGYAMRFLPLRVVAKIA